MKAKPKIVPPDAGNALNVLGDVVATTGCLHRVSKNPAAKGNTRVLAVVLHPRDARQITIPVPKK